MNYFKFLNFFFFALLIIGCKEEKPTAKPKFDLDKILLKGKITVLIDNCSLSFFELRGKNMGFEYEILDSFIFSTWFLIFFISGYGSRFCIDFEKYSC